ncbi:hypothetical protein BB560_000471 [Smittium megazygosporum]|uniref:Uncharacterized protein n=1 Tax=Smittium megazygosporum TaxID=133381 RepID=A0A2T9ZKG8_9FUNG|nr:hypothetical protein BB560_000471 [Smittium megazygosporum]
MEQHLDDRGHSSEGNFNSSNDSSPFNDDLDDFPTNDATFTGSNFDEWIEKHALLNEQAEPDQHMMSDLDYDSQGNYSQFEGDSEESSIGSERSQDNNDEVTNQGAFEVNLIESDSDENSEFESSSESQYVNQDEYSSDIDPSLHPESVLLPESESMYKVGSEAGFNLNSDSEAGVETGSNLNSDSEVEPELGPNYNSDSEAGAETGSNLNSDSEVEPELGPNYNSDSEVGAEVESNLELILKSEMALECKSSNYSNPGSSSVVLDNQDTALFNELLGEFLQEPSHENNENFFALPDVSNDEQDTTLPSGEFPNEKYIYGYVNKNSCVSISVDSDDIILSEGESNSSDNPISSINVNAENMSNFEHFKGQEYNLPNSGNPLLEPNESHEDNSCLKPSGFLTSSFQPKIFNDNDLKNSLSNEHDFSRYTTEAPDMSDTSLLRSDSSFMFNKRILLGNRVIKTVPCQEQHLPPSNYKLLSRKSNEGPGILSSSVQDSPELCAAVNYFGTLVEKLENFTNELSNLSSKIDFSQTSDCLQAKDLKHGLNFESRAPEDSGESLYFKNSAFSDIHSGKSGENETTSLSKTKLCEEILNSVDKTGTVPEFLKNCGTSLDDPIIKLILAEYQSLQSEYRTVQNKLEKAKKKVDIFESKFGVLDEGDYESTSEEQTIENNKFAIDNGQYDTGSPTTLPRKRKRQIIRSAYTVGKVKNRLSELDGKKEMMDEDGTKSHFGGGENNATPLTNKKRLLNSEWNSNYTPVKQRMINTPNSLRNISKIGSLLNTISTPATQKVLKSRYPNNWISNKHNIKK